MAASRKLIQYVVRLLRPDNTVDDEAHFRPNERGFDMAMAQWEKWYREHGKNGYTVTREPVFEPTAMREKVQGGPQSNLTLNP